MANDKNIKVKITLDGVQEFRTQLKAVSQATDQLGKDFKNLGGALADSAKKFALIGTAIAGVATAIVGLTAKNAEAAESFQNVAERSGNSVETVQTFAKIAGDAGLNSDAAGKGLARFTKNMTELKDPTSATSKEIDLLAPGLRASLLSASNADERFAILRNTLSGVTDESTALNIANLLGGKAFQELLPVLQQTDAEYLKQQKRLKELGVILTDVQNKQLATFDDAFDEVGTAIDGVGKQLSVVFAPALTEAANAFTTFIIQNRQPLIDFAALITGELTSIVKGFFTLLSSGPEAQGVDERARSLYNNFILFRDAVVGAFNTVKPVLDAFLGTLNLVAGAIGAGSGAQLGLTLAFLQFTGIFKVAVAAIAVGRSTFVLLATSIQAAPAAIALFTSAFTKAAPLVVGAINLIRTTFLAAVVAIQISGVTLTGVLTGIRLAFLAVWAAVTGPIGLVILALTAVAAAIAFIIDKTIGWEKAIELVKNFFTQLGATALQVLGAIGSAIASAAQAIKTAFFGVLTYVATTIVQGIVKAFQTIGSLITPALTAAFNLVKNFFAGVVTGISNVIKSAFDALKAQVLAVFDSIKNAFQSAIQAIQNTINTVKSAVSSVIGGNKATPKVGTEKFGPGFAGGGKVSGPGTSTSDSILARLSNGEYVVKAAAVRKYGKGFMDAINSGVVNFKGYATGGLVEAVNSLSGMSGPTLQPALAGGIGVSGGGSSGRPLNLVLPSGQVIRTTTSESTAKRLEKDLRRSDFAKTGQLPRWHK